MFCVECGKEGELHGGLCSECFINKNTFITFPKQIEVDICVHCGARKRGKGWVFDDDRNQLEEIVLESANLHGGVKDFDVHFTPNFEDENNVNLKIITHAKVDNLKAAEEHGMRLRFKKTVCGECSRKHGGYWEAKIQFRGSKRDFSEEELERVYDIVEDLVAGRTRKDSGAFVSKVEKIHSGLDFYLGSNSLAKVVSKKLAAEFGGEITESHQLIGKKDGKNVFRMTYLVRTYDFRVGDFVLLDSKPYRVLKVSQNRVQVRALDSGECRWISLGELSKAKVLGGKELITEMVVVSKSDSEIQVLDPDSLKTVEVLIPPGLLIEDESVKIVKCDAGYFFIGE